MTAEGERNQQECEEYEKAIGSGYDKNTLYTGMKMS